MLVEILETCGYLKAGTQELELKIYKLTASLCWKKPRLFSAACEVVTDEEVKKHHGL